MRWSISSREWHEAKTYLQGKPDGTKYSNKESKLTNSFILINGIVYALKPKEYIGKGTYAKTKFVQDEQGGLYLAKITYKEGYSSSKPVSVFLVQKAGLIKPTSSLKKEHKILSDLGLSKGSANINDSKKEIIVMEYLGIPLSKFISTHKMNKADESEIALGILEELDKFHSGSASARGIKRIHGDLKEANITVDNHGRVHIIDFGFSQKTVNGIGKYASGTPSYLAPEIEENQEAVTFHSDIYSLGIIFSNCFPNNYVIQRLAQLMTNEEPDLRPSLSLLKLPMYLLNNRIDDIIQLGYSELGIKAVSALLIASDDNNILFDEINLTKLAENNTDLIKHLAAAFDYLKQTSDNQSHGRDATRLYIRRLISSDLSAEQIAKETMKYLRGEQPYSRIIGNAASTHHTNSRLAFFYDNGLICSGNRPEQPQKFELLSEQERKKVLTRIKH